MAQKKRRPDNQLTEEWDAPWYHLLAWPVRITLVPMTLGNLLRSRSADNAAKTVLYCGDEAMSGEELERSTSRLAQSPR